jgi:4-hydroxybenzoate polyprenyltransferase/phosphoserine phosphatase
LFQAILDRPNAAAALVPLCVDLDGTLVKSDTLVDSLLVMARTRPALLLRLPERLLHGKAALKAFISQSIRLDVAHLPYNRKLLTFLHREREQGRTLYLATGADIEVARRVAAHLGIFEAVLGSDGITNLTGKDKLDRLRAQLHRLHNSEAFGYIGNALPDLPLLGQSSEPMVANPSLRLRMALRARGIHPTRNFVETGDLLKSLLKAIRLHQWAKNLLVLAPFLLAHRLSMGRLAAAALAFLCFGLTASATYIVNDLLDIEADRRHPRKRLRPFAAGDLPVSVGLGVTALFLLLALAAGRMLPPGFHLWLLAYLATTLAYSVYLKRVPLVDVLVLSGLYTLRLLAGGAATQTPISHWLAGFSIFLFLSLAFVKRFAELDNLRDSGISPKNGRGYLVVDIEQLRIFGTASAFAAAVVFANYITGRDVEPLYRDPKLLWLIMPFILLWLSRVWLLASRGELDEDPVVFAMTDRISLLIGAAVAVVALLAS